MITMSMGGFLDDVWDAGKTVASDMWDTGTDAAKYLIPFYSTKKLYDAYSEQTADDAVPQIPGVTAPEDYGSSAPDLERRSKSKSGSSGSSYFPDSTPSPSPASSEGGSVWPWVVGGAILAGAGGLAVYAVRKRRRGRRR